MDTPFPRARALLIAALLAGCAALPAHDPAAAAAAPPPSTYWRPPDPATQGAACRAVLDALRARVRAQPTTAMMAVRGDRIVFAEGPIAHPSQIASARKSLLAMLYGRPVAEGRIDLDATLADLGIDDVGGLLPIERTARVRDLLAARSGVYHPAANGGDDAQDAPPRGSQAPGTYFLYNNWDFNALGDIYEQRTGRAIYDAFADEIATPLGLEDWHRDREHRSGDTARSIHRAYYFHLSARDMARIGELMLADGRWDGRQLLPAGWARTITTTVTPAVGMHPARRTRHAVGYGLLWWVPEPPPGSPIAPALAGAAMAWGYFGQWILVMPARGMVVVHKFETDAIPGAPGGPRTLPVETFLQEAAELADAPCG
jgi:CubicO group peptidase (beta-lactamase class C family)